MRKLLFVIFLLSFHILSYAPNKQVLYIPTVPTINYYSIIGKEYAPLVEAIVKVESNGNLKAYNKAEGAIGAFQIRQCRIKHYNKLTGKNYTHEDMYDFNKAKEVFLYFAAGKPFEQAAKNWNGSGPMTIKYWEKVQKALHS
jgi:hypothetical protein